MSCDCGEACEHKSDSWGYWVRKDGAVIDLSAEDHGVAANLTVCRLCHSLGEICPRCGRCEKCGCKPWCNGA